MPTEREVKLAEAVMQSWLIAGPSCYICVHCKQIPEGITNVKHEPTCIVLEAEAVIKESEERDG